MWRFLRRVVLAIRQQEFSSTDITITAESTRAGAPCPSCGRVSRRRHSSYPRLLMDLPADGRTVNIQLLVLRFRCANPACRRRVSAEPFPQLGCRHARRTKRPRNLLTHIGVLLGSGPALGFRDELHAPVSPDTILHPILHLLYRMELAPAPTCVWSASTTGRGAKVCDTGPLCAIWEKGWPVELLLEARANVLARMARRTSRRQDREPRRRRSVCRRGRSGCSPGRYRWLTAGTCCKT